MFAPFLSFTQANSNSASLPQGISVAGEKKGEMAFKTVSCLA